MTELINPKFRMNLIDAPCFSAGKQVTGVSCYSSVGEESALLEPGDRAGVLCVLIINITRRNNVDKRLQ